MNKRNLLNLRFEQRSKKSHFANDKNSKILRLKVFLSKEAKVRPTNLENLTKKLC